MRIALFLTAAGLFCCAQGSPMPMPMPRPMPMPVPMPKPMPMPYAMPYTCENGACSPIIPYAFDFYGAPRICNGLGNTYGYGGGCGCQGVA